MHPDGVTTETAKDDWDANDGPEGTSALLKVGLLLATTGLLISFGDLLHLMAVGA